MPEPEATEATINLIYKAYYAEMGGAGAPPDLPAQSGPSGGRQCDGLQAPASPPAQGRERFGSKAPAPGGA